MVWKLQIGIHKGTKNSRETAIHTTKYGDPHEVLHSLEEVEACAKAWAEDYQALGYYVWFAHAIGPAGETIALKNL